MAVKIPASTPPWILYQKVWDGMLEGGSQQTHYEDPAPYYSCPECSSTSLIYLQPRTYHYDVEQTEGIINLSPSGLWQINHSFNSPYFQCLNCTNSFGVPEDRIMEFSDRDEIIAHSSSNFIFNTLASQGEGTPIEEAWDAEIEDEFPPEEPF